MFKYSDWVTETNPRKLKKYYTNVLLKSNFELLDMLEKHFNPYGYTALFLLGESHFAIHTFPEQNKTYIELCSCVKKQFDKFIGLIE